MPASGIRSLGDSYDRGYLRSNPALAADRSGETTKTITVQVPGNHLGIDEQFYINLSGASGNARIIDGQGVGTIHYYFVQPYVDPGDCTPDHPYYPNC